MNLDTRIQRMAQDTLDEGKTGAQNQLKTWLHTEHKYDHLLTKRLTEMDNLKLCEPHIDLQLFPVGSWHLQIDFTLAKPYLSKDDEAFYIIDNPVKKEKVFRVPYVSPATWKGNLREALRLGLDWQDEDETMRWLMGNERKSEENFRAGRLHFFPTYFDRLDLEVINPHDRTTGAGKMPIYLEVVPAKSKGIFHLLYVPFDQLHESEETRCQQAWALLAHVQAAMQFLLVDLGVAAKKSSGFGIAEAASLQPKIWRKETAGVTHER